ncbi:MAG: S-adenosylmethionine tRNA ribosyltransferase [Alphaproteobacteria bacterium]|nr:S-adenosylmethionine tRNA ribosyltransferase [Alphaproteobacteria bacterium]
MIAANRPQSGSRLLSLDAQGLLREVSATQLPRLLRRGDVVVANDAATLPASFHGVHLPTGEAIEVRLAGKLDDDAARFVAIVFGAGNYRTRTEHRAPPPLLRAGDRLLLGSLVAEVERSIDHARVIALRFVASEAELWSGFAAHGKPIQYAHVVEPLKLWDVWTRAATMPMAFEPPSAGFALTWKMLDDFAARGTEFATLTHAAGISSTGDAELDKRLPFDEAYVIPESTVRAIRRAKAEGGRVVAIGTTVVRALEHASRNGTLRAGRGVATNRLGPGTKLKLVDAIVSGVHAAGESHYELLKAFATGEQLQKMTEVLELRGFCNHEFGDFVLIEREQSRTTTCVFADGNARMRYSNRGQQEGLRS